MREYSTEAVVLDKEDVGDLDALISLYTPHQGKVVARAKSVRKITSKLAASLEPANIISARILSQDNHHIVDALSLSRSSEWRTSFESLRELTHFLMFIKEITPEGEKEFATWEMIQDILKLSPQSLKPYYAQILMRAGFDLNRARCEGCKNEKPDYFIPAESLFVCKRCYKMPEKNRNEFKVVLS